MFTTRQAAKQLGIPAKTLSNYIIAKKVPTPKIIRLGGFVVHSWTEKEIDHVRRLLPKIANGRKTRWQRQKQREKAKTATNKKK